MKTILASITILAILVGSASTEPQQTRVYDSRGNSIGTSVPTSDGSVRYYDSRGNSLGTSTTLNGTTTYYSPLGNMSGTTSGPAPFPGRTR
jgi:hypothetical protein